MSIADLRREYSQAGLREEDVDANPVVQFRKWFEEARAQEIIEPNAMILATVDASGQPSTRVVLLKGVEERGFSFFTNYASRKGHELAANPRASLTFPWLALERQVCITGSVSQLSRSEAEAYFKTRPRGSRLGAWASTQSQVIPGRDFLETRARALPQAPSSYATSRIVTGADLKSMMKDLSSNPVLQFFISWEAWV